MKKLTCLLLVIIACSVLVGCDWKNIFNKETSPEWEAPEGVVETTTTDKDGNSITIAHSDNFTQDDIEFIMMFNGKMRNDRAVADMPPSYLLGDILSMGQAGEPLFLVHFSNPYIICAYLKPDSADYELNEFGSYKFDATKYVWYKYADSSQIAEEIDGMKLTKDVYLLYDCIIERDIVNNVEYNKNCKYYLNYKSEATLNITSSDMLLYVEPQRVTNIIGDNQFIAYPEYGGGVLDVYIDENAFEYIYFYYGSYNPDGTVYQNYAKYLLGEHYDVLVPHFEMLNESINDKGRTLKYAGIRLDIVVDYLINER